LVESLNAYIAAKQRATVFREAGEEGVSQRTDAGDCRHPQRQRNQEYAKSGEPAAEIPACKPECQPPWLAGLKLP
jgi:hypothetical protein